MKIVCATLSSTARHSAYRINSASAVTERSESGSRYAALPRSGMTFAPLVFMDSTGTQPIAHGMRRISLLFGAIAAQCAKKRLVQLQLYLFEKVVIS